QPRVDVEGVERGDLVALLGRADVDGLASRVHEAHQLLAGERSVHGHLAGEEVTRVEAADRVHPDEALVVYVAHEETDLVHVRGHHDLRGVGLAALLDGYEVTERVHPQLVDLALELGADDGTNILLAARYAGRFT